MAELYADENFPLPVVEELRLLGHNVLTAYEAGKALMAIPDDEVLAFALELGRAVLTINRKHFIKLDQDGKEHAGIIVCTFDPDFTGQADRIDKAIKDKTELSGQLIRVNRL